MGGSRDGGWQFLHLGGVTKWNSQFFKYTWTFLAIICVASQLFLCFFWIHIWVKTRCLQHPCFKNLCKIAQASKNSDSNAQHFLSDLLTHSWFHSMLFALPGYQFPYTVMNRCLYLRLFMRSNSNTTSEHTTQVENNYFCGMQNNQWKPKFQWKVPLTSSQTLLFSQTHVHSDREVAESKTLSTGNLVKQCASRWHKITEGCVHWEHQSYTW
jgi:hypothetical protein